MPCTCCTMPWPLCLLRGVTVIVIQDSSSDGIQDLHFLGRCHGKTLGNRLRLDGNPDTLDSETSRSSVIYERNRPGCITNNLNSCFDAADRIRLQGCGNPKASACICCDENIRRRFLTVVAAAVSPATRVLSAAPRILSDAATALAVSASRTAALSEVI